MPPSSPDASVLVTTEDHDTMTALRAFMATSKRPVPASDALEHLKLSLALCLRTTASNH